MNKFEHAFITIYGVKTQDFLSLLLEYTWKNI